MKKLNNILKVSLCLFVVYSFQQCSNKTISSECKSRKIQLLLENLFNKKANFPVFKLVNLINSPNNPPDSSLYFVYLYSPNLKIPNNEFYLHWNKYLVPNYPDSIKLRVINDPTIIKDVIAFRVGISLLEFNADTTKLKLKIDFGVANRAVKEGIFTYSFDEKNCIWNVLDSTITFY